MPVLPGTGPHVPLPCSPLSCPGVAAARVEAREGRNSGDVRALLSNPRWGERLVRFLELSGVGRVMADGVDEDEARSRRIDRWIV